MATFSGGHSAPGAGARSAGAASRSGITKSYQNGFHKGQVVHHVGRMASPAHVTGNARPGVMTIKQNANHAPSYWAAKNSFLQRNR